MEEPAAGASGRCTAHHGEHRFTGAGFDSRNLHRKVVPDAFQLTSLGQLLFSAARTMRLTSAGIRSSHADQSVRAHAYRRQRHIVVARENLEAAGQRVNQFGDLGALPLASLMAWMLDAAAASRTTVSGSRFTACVRARCRAPREAVHRLRQSQKVLKLAFLRGLVVVRIGRKHRVQAAYLLELAGLAHQRTGRVVGAAGPHRHASPAASTTMLTVLSHSSSSSVAASPVDPQATRSRFPRQSASSQRLERLFVNCSVRPEGRYDRCSTTYGSISRKCITAPLGCNVETQTVKLQNCLFHPSASRPSRFW